MVGVLGMQDQHHHRAGHAMLKHRKGSSPNLPMLGEGDDEWEWPRYVLGMHLGSLKQLHMICASDGQGICAPPIVGGN